MHMSRLLVVGMMYFQYVVRRQSVRGATQMKMALTR